MTREIGYQLPLYQPTSDWRPTPVSDLPRWGDARRVAIDVETRDPQLVSLGPGCRRAGSYVCGIAVAVEDGPSCYIPIRHGVGENLDEAQVWRYMRDEAARFSGDLVNINLPYDVDWMGVNGVAFHKARRLLDVGVAEAVIYELHRSYKLDDIARRHELPQKDKARMREYAAAYGWRSTNLGQFIWMLPPEAVVEYATWDAELALRIMRKQERRIAEEDLSGVWDLECRVLPVAIAMTRRGVRIDEDRLGRVVEWSLEQEAESLGVIERESGVRVDGDDLQKAAVIARPLEAVGVKLGRTAKTNQPSVTVDVLRALDSPGMPTRQRRVAGAMMRARKVRNLRTNFCAGIERRLAAGRIHCLFNQVKRDKDGGGVKGARSGRFSAEHPNLQQQFGSKEPELALLIRDCFVADEGRHWASLDFSQQEPRLAIHFAVLAGIQGAREAADRYSDPTVDFHDATTRMVFGDDIPADQWTTRRRHGKDIFLGKCYGMRAAKFCLKAGLPTEEVWSARRGEMVTVAGEEGAAMYERFSAQMPWLDGLSQAAQLAAIRNGYVRTLLGRKVHFPELRHPTETWVGDRKIATRHDWTHKALNGVVQGSAGDQIKLAMVLAEEAGHELQLTEHDELDLSVRDERQADEVLEIMRDCVELEVPMKVTKCLGESWACSIEK